jgi:hypothetical protein
VSEALVFNTEPKTSHVPDIPFTLDDREYTAHAPKKAAWGMLVGTLTNAKADAFHATITFLDSCLDIADQTYLEARLRDREDDLDIDDLIIVVDSLVQAWEPYLGDEFAELTGENRPTRRAAARRTQKKAPARRPAAATAKQ